MDVDFVTKTLNEIVTRF